MSVNKSRPKSRNTSGLIPGKGRGPKKGAPNAGRPRSDVRDAMRLALTDRIHVLTAIADGELVHKMKIGEGEEVAGLCSASPGDRIRALEVLAKYGVGTSDELTGTAGGPLTVLVEIAREGRKGNTR